MLQAALSLVLLAGAGLMAQTLRNLTEAAVRLRDRRRRRGQRERRFRRLLPPKNSASIYGEIERQSAPDSAASRNVALALYSPMSGDNWQIGATLEDRPDQSASPSWDRVSPGFFDTIGARILRGRGFNDATRRTPPHVAVVNQAFADAYFPNQDPLGKRFGLGGLAHRADYQIVGIVNTIRFRDPRGPRPSHVLYPAAADVEGGLGDNMQARSNLIGSISCAWTSAPRDGSPRGAAVLGARRSRTSPCSTSTDVRAARRPALARADHRGLAGGLRRPGAGPGLVGLYGITSYSVARRTSEIGVRTALGATRGQVVRLILGGALAQAGIGLALGIPAALAAGRLLATSSTA